MVVVYPNIKLSVVSQSFIYEVVIYLLKCGNLGQKALCGYDSGLMATREKHSAIECKPQHPASVSPSITKFDLNFNLNIWN